jgi:hypothetical protein
MIGNCILLCFKPQPLLSDGSLWISINISHFLQDPDVLFLKLIGFIMFCSSFGEKIRENDIC